MAEWCMHTGFGPEVYLSLSQREINAFVEAANKRPRMF